MLRRLRLGSAIGVLVALGIALLGNALDRLLVATTRDTILAVGAGVIAAGIAGGTAAELTERWPNTTPREAGDEDHQAELAPGCIGTFLGVTAIWATIALFRAIVVRAQLDWSLTTNTPVADDPWYPFAASFGLLAACYPFTGVGGYLLASALVKFRHSDNPARSQILLANIFGATFTVMVQWLILFWRNW
jgi:hypothetical protein